jgi:alpha-glucosidase
VRVKAAPARRGGEGDGKSRADGLRPSVASLRPSVVSLLLPLTLALLGCATRVAGRPAEPERRWEVVSPGGVVRIEIRLAGGRLQYRAEQGGGGRSEVLGLSPLGITRSDESFVEGLSFLTESTRAVDERYDLLRGKRSHYANRGVERALSFENARHGRIDLVVRAFDDGFAFRYRFPERDGGRHTVVSEETGFRVPDGARGFMGAHDRRRNHRPDYESSWQLSVPAGTASDNPAGWIFPALFETPAHRWLLLTESGLDASYCATHLAATAPGGVYRIAFPDPGEVDGKFDATPSWTLPWSTPWRVVITGDRLATVVESSLVTDLAPPSVVADTSWIHPGRASWSWWSDGGSPRAYARLLPFVDLAADMRWEYTLVDSGWTAMEGGSWQQLADYARGKGVGLLLWYHSGVPHANYRGRDTLWVPEKRRAEMARIAGGGVKGIKIDFFDSDKQQVIQNYLGILDEAARAHLLIDFHGSTLPRGWDRTYPNLMSMEAVRGAENYGSDEAFAEGAPAQHTVLVFTRNVVGPMDYTPVLFSPSRPRRADQRAAPLRRTTFGHELALAVVFESGLQHFPDAVERYRSLPAEAQDVLRAVPVAWDETRLLDGEPGKLAVLLRRRGDVSYVAGINGEAVEKRFVVPAELAGQGEGLLIADGETATSFAIRRLAGGAAVEVRLRPHGGFVLRLAQKRTAAATRPAISPANPPSTPPMQ